MSKILNLGARMTYEEKGTWVYLLACTAAYAVYLAIVGPRLANVIYLGFVLWAVSGSVLRLVTYRRGG
jgi:hypothetical protein